MKSIKIRFRILNRDWTLRLLKRKAFEKKHGEGVLAVTLLHRCRIDALPAGFAEETIVHELVHAYLGELCTHSASLDQENFEEVVAELFSKRGAEMLKLGKRLAKEVKQKTS